MAKYTATHLAHGSLIYQDKGTFRRGTHEGRTIESVAAQNPSYILWLAKKGKISDADREFVEEFIEQNPEYFAAV